MILYCLSCYSFIVLRVFVLFTQLDYKLCEEPCHRLTVCSWHRQVDSLIMLLLHPRKLKYPFWLKPYHEKSSSYFCQCAAIWCILSLIPGKFSKYRNLNQVTSPWFNTLEKPEWHNWAREMEPLMVMFIWALHWMFGGVTKIRKHSSLHKKGKALLPNSICVKMPPVNFGISLQTS